MEIKDVNEFEDEISLIKNPCAKIPHQTDGVAHCAFDDLTDLTSLHMANYLDSYKFSSSCLYPLKKRDCVCYHKDDSAVIYSNGGTKYIVPVSIKILKVFPLEEGLIFQCEYNPDAIRFSLASLHTDTKSFAYLTLNSHPLNDLHPLAIFTGDPISPFHDLVCTKLELIYASTELPCAVFYDSDCKELIIGILRINPEREEYLSSLDPAKRHLLLPRAASTPHLLLESVYRLPLALRSDCAFIFSGFGRNEFTLAVHVGERQVTFIDGEIGENGVVVFNLSRKCENILSIVKVEDKYNCEGDTMPRLCNPALGGREEVSLFMGRLERIKAHLVALDGNGCIQIFRGPHIIFGIDLYSASIGSFCPTGSFNGICDMLKTSHPVKISGGKDWNINVSTDKEGVTAKVALEILQRDPLVNSILEAIQAVIPKSLFICLYSDYLEMLHARKAERETASELGILKELLTGLIQRKQAGLLLESPFKRRRMDLVKEKSQFNTAGAWREMIGSEYHLVSGTAFDDLFGKELNEKVEGLKDVKSTGAMVDIAKEKMEETYRLRTDAEEFIRNIENVLKVLHLLYEDLKLQKCHSTYIEPMAGFLFQLVLCLDVSYSPYTEYYIREHPHIYTLHSSIYEQYCQTTLSGLTAETLYTLSLKSPPDILSWVSKKLSSCCSSADSLIIFYEHTRVICRIFEILTQDSPGYQISTQLPFSQSLLKLEGCTKTSYPIFCSSNSRLKSKRSKRFPSDYYLAKDYKGNKMEKVLTVLLEEGISTEEIENNWPYSIALPLHNILWYAREHPLHTWGEKMYQLIGREDIALNLRLGSQTRKTFPRAHRSYYSNSSQFSPKRTKAQQETEKTRQQRIKECFVGVEVYKELLGNEFRDGETEGGRVSNREAKSIAEYRFTADLRYKEVLALLDSSRVIKLRTHNIKEEDKVSEEKFEAAKQALLYKMATRQLSKCVGRGALTYGTLLTLPTETLEISKISLVGKVPPKDTKIVLDLKDEVKEKELSSWPEFHNGVAAGLRLARESTIKGGNTRNWILYQKPRNPKFEHGGFLLAIGLLGYLDCLLSTDIYQYLKAAHEATTIGILIGSAASKMGSMDDSLSRTLCLHIPFLLPPSFEIEISMPIQSAAILGAGLLYFGTSHRLMTEMILSQIGRKPLSDRCMDREVYALCAGFALGFVNINYSEKAIGLSDLQLEERLVRLIEGGKVMDPPLSMLSANMNAESSKCSSVLEGENVNIHITAPGAIMALAIIHMQSDNENIARRLEIPGTFYALEHAKPFHILLKIIAKNLIMWNRIEGTTEWLYKQIPPLVREIFESPIREVQTKYGGTLIAEEEIDYSAIALCYISILSGSILAMGLRYAGTNNKTVMGIICKEIDKLRSMPTTTLKDQNYSVYTDRTKNKIDKYSLDNCLCVCAFAISIIMAGSGDVDCFRALRVLRKHLEKDMNYGHNLALNMCLGFLFLGSGAYTFGQSKTAIAALLCSVYPHFPSNPSDNKYHLQAMRHLYVLALQTRLLQAKDVETGENVQVPLTVTYHSISETITTPAIINQIEKVTNISLKDSRFYDTQVQNLAQANSHWTIYVKRRICTMMYGDSTIMGQNAITQPKISIGDHETNKEYLNADNWKFLANNHGLIVEFLEKLCKYSDVIGVEGMESAVLAGKGEFPAVGELKRIYKCIEEMCEDLKGKVEKELVKEKLYFFKFAVECFSEGKAEVLPVYIWLLNNMRRIDKTSPIFFKEFRVVLGFTNIVGDLFKTIGQRSLIYHSFLSDMKGEIDKAFSAFSADTSTLKTYLHCSGLPPRSHLQRLCEFLSFNEIPSALHLRKALLEIQAEAQKCLSKFKPEALKPLVSHIIELLKLKLKGNPEQFISEEVKQMVYYLWSILREKLPGIDSTMADQLLLLAFEQL